MVRRTQYGRKRRDQIEEIEMLKEPDNFANACGEKPRKPPPQP
jgi:hypothetical protein